MMNAAEQLHAQTKDTLANVKVFSKKQPDVTTATVPVQQLNKTALSKLNSVSVADAVKYFSGVVVKDYGGVGGLKTISVRSLGANHTGVMYDGIMMGDAQGGQTDLGKLSLDNIESIQLFNSNPVDILLPARSYASASILALSSSATNNEERSLTLKLKAGSFGFFNPAFSYKNKAGKKFRFGLSGEYQSADGKYHFTNYETGSGKLTRNNSGIKSYRIEYDAAFYMSDTNKIRAKLYYYNSKRGLPGSVFLYNNNDSHQRLNNENFFGQLNWQKNISAKSRILFCGKFSTDYKYYADPSYPTATLFENKFHQQEIYFSGVYNLKLSSSFQLNYASDYFYSSLKRTDSFAGAFANPGRNTFLNNIAARFNKKRFEINANLLSAIIDEQVEHGHTGRHLNECTPAASASFQPFVSLPFRVRFSYKKIFRAPTFDDLYYTNFGNTALKPEYVDQYNFGVTFNRQFLKILKEIIFTADAYYNKVKDKILVVPRQNLFQWTAMNIGKVDIKGLDVAAHINLKEWKKLDISTGFSYSFQDAEDLSDPTAATYKSQLPYTPKHSGSVNISIGFKKISFNYNVLASSYRYRPGDPIPENIVQGWGTHDVSVSYQFNSKKYWEYKFIAEANNIFNKQYDIIKFYPMPGFNYRLGIIASLNKNR